MQQKLSLTVRSIGKHSALLQASSLCLVILLVAIATGAGRRGKAATSFDGGATPQTGNQGQRTASIIPTLTRFGFQPSEFTLPAGKVLLAVRNYSGLEEVSLTLARNSGQQLLTGNYSKGRKSWDNRFQLPPGEYVLSVAGHPEWTCKITLVPPGRQ